MEPSLPKLLTLLSRGLGGTDDLRGAAAICRSLALSDADGAAAFLLFALYLENLADSREGNPTDADMYSTIIAEVVPPMQACLRAIETFDPASLLANLDSFARMALRLPLP